MFSFHILAKDTVQDILDGRVLADLFFPEAVEIAKNEIRAY